MEESSTYQFLLRKEAKKILLLQGREKFGPAHEEIITAIQSVNGLDRLERMALRVLKASNWDELLATG